VRRTAGLGLSLVLIALWVLLWGELSVANVVSGALVVALVVAVLPDVGVGFTRPTVQPLWALRFAASVATGLVRANLVVSLEVLTPRPTVNTGIVAVPLPHCSDPLLTLVANVLGLAPGTMPIEVTRDPAVIYVHVLHLHDVEAVRADVTRLAELAVRAFGSPEARAALP
jgi:multicomponent Na+:H+ antiporter subunit E